MRKISLSVVLLLSASTISWSQFHAGCESLLKSVTAFTDSIPKSINAACDYYTNNKTEFENLRNSISAEYKVLAEKAEYKSQLLNDYAGIKGHDAGINIPMNDKMTAFFRKQTEKINKCETQLNNKVKPFYGKSLYAKSSYEAVWDSVYKSRIPALTTYRAEILKILNENLSYLKTNAALMKSKEEGERIQYMTSHLEVLGNIHLLINRYFHIVFFEGAKIVPGCKVNIR